MPTRLLYALALPESSLQQPRGSDSTRVSSQPQLSNDTAAVSPVASEAGTERVRGIFAGRFSEIQATEVEELVRGSGVDVLPLTLRGEQGARDGYYVAESAESVQASARSEDLWRFDARLQRRGTPRSHYRALRTTPQNVDSAFGSGGAAEIGLSIQARKVRWYDAVTGALEDATAQRVVAGEHGDQAIYDADEPSFDDPRLIYSIPLAEEFHTDCTVWDDYGRSDKQFSGDYTGATVGSASVGSDSVGSQTQVASQWQRVFATDHDWRGDAIMETDRLRLRVPQPAEDVLRAYRWSPSGGQWTLVQLGQSDWRLYDMDLREVGVAEIRVRLTMQDTATGDRQAVDARLVRGLDSAVMETPDGSSTPPQGVIDRLDPIAVDGDRAAVPTDGLVERQEVQE